MESHFSIFHNNIVHLIKMKVWVLSVDNQDVNELYKGGFKKEKC